MKYNVGRHAEPPSRSLLPPLIPSPSPCPLSLSLSPFSKCMMWHETPFPPNEVTHAPPAGDPLLCHDRPDRTADACEDRPAWLQGHVPDRGRHPPVHARRTAGTILRRREGSLCRSQGAGGCR